MFSNSGKWSHRPTQTLVSSVDHANHRHSAGPASVWPLAQLQWHVLCEAAAAKHTLAQRRMLGQMDVGGVPGYEEFLKVIRNTKASSIDGNNSGNSRNGYSENTIKSRFGEPQIIKKYETTSTQIEHQIIAMYAKGMSVRDIEDHMRDKIMYTPQKNHLPLLARR